MPAVNMLMNTIMKSLTLLLVFSCFTSSAVAASIQANPRIALAVDTAPQLTLTSTDKRIETVAEMEKIFARPESVHRASLAAFSAHLTLPKAIAVLQHSMQANASSLLTPVTNLLTDSKSFRSSHDGDIEKMGGLDGARKMLNKMILESNTKYDKEIAKCTAYYAKQCALMETARGQIAASNNIAANSRALILDAQANINRDEIDVPKTKQELKDHNAKCKGELKKLNWRLKAVMEDIAVMTMILEMTDCDTKKLLQLDKLAMLRCEDECTKKTYVTFNHKQLQAEVKQLHAADLVSAAFGELFEDQSEPVETSEFVQVQGSDYLALANKTKFNNPPLPMTKVPRNPCTDPNQGAPSKADKRAAKCTLKKSPQCYKIQGKFLQIQAGIQDERDQLMEDISKLEDSCEETRMALKAIIETDEANLASMQTKLAAATEKEAGAGENARQVAKENEQYNADLVKQMKSCSKNYVNFEQELCALKKIRGDVFKKFKKGHTGFFQDCELSKWSPEACTAKCSGRSTPNGGVQDLTRSLLSHPDGGSACLPLKAKRKCGLSPCPVNCDLKMWSGWSKCSAECGGGVQQRVRDIRVAMKHGGTPCEATSESRACNVQACEKDCELHPWTKWTGCSKDCDGGSRKRQRFVKVPTIGSGKCAGQWSEERLQYKKCNAHRCKVPNPAEALKCNKTLDIVLMLDGTPKGGKEVFAAQVKAAKLFVDAFSGKGITVEPNFAVIWGSGPRTWSGVSKCTGKSKKKINMEKTCHVQIANHFSTSIKKTKGVLDGLKFKPGAKLFSMALLSAKSELALSRANAPAIVVAFVDGEPLSYRKTKIAARNLRKKARLLIVPVAKFSPLKTIRKLASRRWQENVVVVSDAKALSSPDTATHIVANICPSGSQKVKPVRKK
jgi:hypothetical protein